MEKLPCMSMEGIDYRRERLEDFYKSKKFADCTFIINGVEVKAHKLILACVSPVFEKMFSGEMASSEIKISDINVEEFSQVLEFIYTEFITISSMVHAWSLYYIANKYFLDDLLQICRLYILKNITMNSLVLSYEYAEMYSLQVYKKKWFLDIINYVKGVFCSDYHMKPSTLCAILDEPIVIDRLELVLHILNWAVVECNLRNVPQVRDNIIDVLKEEGILKYIRKSWITDSMCDECCAFLLWCQCVDPIIHETLGILDVILTSTEDPNADKNLFKSTPTTCCLRSVYQGAYRKHLHNNKEYVTSVSANRKMILFGILVKTEMNPTGSFGEMYEGSVTVRICKQDTITSIVKPTTFIGVVHYDSDLYLHLKELVILEPDLLYDIRISYKNKNNIMGVIPIHCYYMSNQLNNRSNDSVISFYETSGRLVKGVSFYPA